MTAARVVLLAAVLALNGCCLKVVSGGGWTTGTAATTGGTSGGTQVCGQSANLSDIATHISLPLNRMVSADLNGDGLLDLVATELSNPAFDVLFGQPDGGLSSPIHYLGTDGQAVAVGDLNGDGRPDVAVSVGPSLQIFLNEGAGTLNPIPTAVNLDALVMAISIADFNADGLGDLLVGVEGENEFEDLLLWGQEDGTFSTPRVIPGLPGGGGAPGFLVSDLNHDGLPDIVTNTDDGYQLAVLLNQGDGGFEISLYSTQAAFQLVSVPNAGAAPDVAFGAVKSNAVQLLKNSGHGTFSISPLYLFPAGDNLPSHGGEQLTVGDFNGDCIPDIATDYGRGCEPFYDAGQILVFYGDGDGGFGAPVSLPTTFGVPAGLASLGRVTNPRAFVVGDECGGGATVYGDASKH